MVANSNRVYQAKRIREMLENGVNFPKVVDIVFEVLSRYDGCEMKKEDIDLEVSYVMHEPLDDSIKGAVSSALRKLEDEGLVIHAAQGYWCKR